MKKLTLLFLFLFIGTANAAVINFEGSGGNVSPANPYTENGFTFTPINSESAVFPAGGSYISGDDTGIIAFAETNSITITTQSSRKFDLNSLLIGLTTIASNPSADITITGNLAAGGTVSETFAGVSALTLAALNWTRLSSVTVTATDDVGFDSIIATIDPFPWMMFMSAIKKPTP